MKNFLILSTSFFGDTLLSGPLCQSLKAAEPTAQIIFVANEPFVEAARFMKGVDEAIGYDKKGRHKGFWGALKFYRENKDDMPKIDAAFVIYGNERNILLARLFGARKVYADNGGLMRPFLSHGRIDFGGLTHVQDKNAFLATLYTKKEFKPYAMCYEPPQVALRKAAELMAGCTAPVAVCTTTKKVAKDMPVEECARLMRLLNKRGNSPVFVGSGKMASVYRDSLLKMGAKFLDLTNKTSLPVLGAVLKKCGALVSVDTGTLHMGLSAGAATVAVYYVNNEKHIAAWSPKDLYRHRLIKGPDFSAENMIKKLEEMEKEEKEEANEQ